MHILSQLERSISLRNILHLVIPVVLILPSYGQKDQSVSPLAPVPTFKADTRAVIVDVVVNRSDGEPVTGLHQQDFRMNEDGKPQPIVFFEEHNPAPAIPADLPKMPPSLFTNVPTALPSDSVNIILLDGLNTERKDQSYVRDEVIRFLRKMPPNSPLAVFTLLTRLRLVQGFTGDSTTLLAALRDKKSGVWPEGTEVSRAQQDDVDDADHIRMRTVMMGGHTTEGIATTAKVQQDYKGYEAAQRIDVTDEALQNLARYLPRIPGRKNLIWFAGQFPVGFSPVTTVKGSAEVGRRTGVRNTVQVGQQSAHMKETADLVTVSRVAIYPVSAIGMEVSHACDPTSATKEFCGVLSPQEAEDSAANIAAMGTLASETGGEVIRNSNDLSNAITHVIQNGSHYYTLSYTPTNTKMDGQFHRIEVDVPESHYKLAYRRGYYALDSQPSQTRSESNPLQYLLQRGAPASSQILFAERITPANPQPETNAPRAGASTNFKGPFIRYDVDLMIRWTDLDLQPTPDGNHNGTMRVELIAYDRDGKALNWAGGVTKMTLKPEIYSAIQKSGVPAHVEIDVPKGDVYLATGVYDQKTGKAGTLEIPLSSLVPANATAQATKVNSK